MRDHAHLVRDLLEHGLEVERGRHLKIRHEGRLVAVTAIGQNHGRGDANLVAALRRSGLLERPQSAPSSPKRGRRPEQPPVPYTGQKRPLGRAPRSEVLP